MNEIIANDRLGAFCHTHVEMKGASRGPLLGLTFAVKDIYDVAAHRTGFGSPDWLRTHGPRRRRRRSFSGCSTRARISSARPTPTN